MSETDTEVNVTDTVIDKEDLQEVQDLLEETDTESEKAESSDEVENISDDDFDIDDNDLEVNEEELELGDLDLDVDLESDTESNESAEVDELEEFSAESDTSLELEDVNLESTSEFETEVNAEELGEAETSDEVEDLDELKEFLSVRQKGIANWMVRSKFRHPDVSWRSFQDMSGHRYTPGCFRCHNGKHRDQDGRPIPLNCTTCHNVPFVQQEQDQRARHENPYGYYKPLSHQQPDFIIKHREMDDQSCQTCHGEIEHGTDNRTFCANAACHAVEWPGLDFDAK